MKKILSIILAMIVGSFCVSGVYAEDIKENVITLDIDKAIEYAVANSKDILKANADLAKANHQMVQARRTYNDFNSSGFSFDEALIDSGYVYESSRIAKNKAERTLKNQINDTIINVKKGYYVCLSSREKTKIAKDNLENAKVKEEYAKQRFDLGMISYLNYKNFSLSLVKARNEYDKALRDEEIAEYDFKAILNLKEDAKLELTGEFNTDVPQYEDIKTALELIKDDDAYLSIQEGKELANKRMSTAKSWYSANEIGYSIETATYNATIAQLDESQTQLINGLRKTYYALLDTKQTLSYLEEYVQFLKENSESSFIQYEMGMITAADYIEIQQNYYKAKNEYQDVQIEYYVLAMQYINSYNS